MAEETIDSLRKELKQANERSAFLQEKVDGYESAGNAKIYYSMNRQLNDLADMMNAKSLKKVNIEDKDDKTIERMKIIHGLVKTISEILPLLRQAGGITDNEEADLRKPFIESVAERRQ